MGVGSGGGGVVRLLGNVLGRGRGSGLGNVLLLLGSVVLDGSGGSHLDGSLNMASGSGEVGVVPALIVLSLLHLVVETRGDGSGGYKVVLLLGLLHVTGSGHGSLLNWGSRGGSDGQVIASGAESGNYTNLLAITFN